MESDSKRQVQVVGKYLTRLRAALALRIVQYYDNSGRRIGYERIAIRRDDQPSRIVETLGKYRNSESWWNPWLKIGRRRDDHRPVFGAPYSCPNSRPPTTDIQ
jgi:hypothetical protein